jgi:hypothetical protein
MTYIDLGILNLTEWLCRRFQILTGRTNVWLAVQLTNLSIIVYFVWAVGVSWSNEIAPRLLIWVFCSGLLYVLTQTVLKVPIETYENAAYQRVAKGLRNPRRVRDALLRISFLTLCVALFYPIYLIYVNLHVHVALLSYLLIILTTVVLYLLACDPLPPCAGKLKAWIRGFAPSRIAASEPSRGEGTSPQSPASLANTTTEFAGTVINEE